MHGVYIGNNRMLVSPLWGGRLIVPADDLSISPDLIINGVIELPLTKFLLHQVKAGQVVVDIGANIGYYSVLLGHLVGPVGHVFACEANPYLIPILADNLSINYLSDRTSIINKAIYSS
ncbi:MAG: FkbM family methyltransferase [Firmicutes bacterium]|nr:FkbM family methyltransferase [Bacillota bacterium]